MLLGINLAFPNSAEAAGPDQTEEEGIITYTVYEG